MLLSTRYISTNKNLLNMILLLSIYTPPTSQLVQPHSVMPSHA